MADRLDVDAPLPQALDGPDVDVGGLEQLLAQGAAQLGHMGLEDGGVLTQDLADQGEAVGVQAAGLQTDEQVPLLEGGAVDHLVLVHQTHGEAGQVVLVLAVHAGHLGGLAADEGAAGLAATLGDAGDDLLDALGLILAHGHIIQEEHGHGAGADDVVDAHSHAVNAHGIVLVHEKGDLQLGADAVGAADQDGLLHALHIGGEQAAEAAQSAHDAVDIGGLHQRLDAVDRLVTGGHVHTGGGVGLGVGVLHLKNLQ